MTDRTLGLRLTGEIALLGLALTKVAVGPSTPGPTLVRFLFALGVAAAGFALFWRLYPPDRPGRKESAAEKALPAILIGIALLSPVVLPSDVKSLVLWSSCVLFIPPLIAVEMQNARSGGRIFRGHVPE